MNKKFLITLLCALLPLLAMAQRITDNEAANIASQVLGKQVVKAEVKKPAKAPSHCDGELDAPFYSIFTGEDGLGFVIVSTDRRAPQVIGYGDGKADASNLPPQLKAILEKQDSVLQVTPNLPEHSSWRKKVPARAGEEGGKLLKTANWGQGYPYNLLTPEIDGEHCPTGCVATAMAIIMKYHGWPEKGRGEHSYDWNGESLSFDYANTTFDWSQMPEGYEEGSFTEAQAQEVSKLMRAAGNAVNMQYGINESGADTRSMVNVLYRYFTYYLPSLKEKVRYYEYGSFERNTEEWNNLIRSQIDENCPILYNASSVNSGHSFVIDGYKNDDEFHINWGWDGLYNGYYPYGLFSPYSEVNFSDEAHFLYNITPEPNPSEEYEGLFVDDGSSFGFSSGYNNILIYPNGDVWWGDEFDIETGRGYSLEIPALQVIEPFDGILTVALIDENQNIIDISYLETELVIPLDLIDMNCRYTNTSVMVGIPSVYFETSKEIKDSYSLQLVYKRTGEENYKFLLGNRNVPTSIPVKGIVNPRFNLSWNFNNWKVGEDIYFTRNDEEGNPLPYVNPSSMFLADYALMSNIGTPFAMVDGLYTSFYQFYGAMCAQIHPVKDYSIDVDMTLYSDMISKECEVVTPGTLNDLITKEEAKRINKLKITGLVQLSDLGYIHDNFVVLEVLDLENATFTFGNYIPTLVFSKFGNLDEIKLPKVTEKICQACLYGHEGITAIDIPNSVTEIERDAFWCRNIIMRNPQPCLLGDNVVTDYVTVFVPRGAKEAYLSAENWNKCKEIIEYDEGTLFNQEQTITWEQNLENLPIGVPVQLENAISSANIPVEIAPCGHIKGRYGAELYYFDNKITINEPQSLILSARSNGNGYYKRARTVFKVVSSSPTISGDVNCDNKIDSQDVFSVINMVLDKETSGDKNAADMNGDGQIDSQDVYMIINKVLGK